MRLLVLVEVLLPGLMRSLREWIVRIGEMSSTLVLYVLVLVVQRPLRIYYVI